MCHELIKPEDYKINEGDKILQIEVIFGQIQKLGVVSVLCVCVCVDMGTIVDIVLYSL